ncbi:MAG: MFS transporter [Dehalococcoidales bacterium]|nr:MFS transporter [Dehalococcoidales bacterium]
MRTKSPRFFYGWWVVAACFSISLFIQGIIGFGFTALIEPLSNKFGWSYTQISFAGSIRGLEVGLLAPAIGLLIDRWGTRIFIISGTVLCGLAMFLLSRVSSLNMFYVSFALIALGMSALSPTVTMTTIANWFNKRIGLATGLMHSGVGFSGLMIPLVVLLIDNFGINKAMVILGIFSLGIITPISFAIRDRPEKYGLLPDGEIISHDKNQNIQTPAMENSSDFRIKEAMRTRAFWYLALAMLFQLLIVNAVTTHMMPYLSSIGIARATASLIASAVPLSSVIGRLGFGWLSDRIDQRHIMATGYALMSLGLLCFTLAALWNPLLLFPAVPLFSIGFGGNATVRASVVRDYFGRKSFGAIHGLVMGLAVIGTITGPPLAGWVFDTWGSYHGIWLAFTIVAVTPLVLMLAMSKPVRNKQF